MALSKSTVTATGTTYQLEGRLLEVCTCGVLCPCWVGADPDGGTCDSALGWHIDSGTIQGVDVSGLTFALSVHIPGNVLKGNWKALAYVGRAEHYRSQVPALGHDLDLQGHNAIQGTFHFVA